MIGAKVLKITTRLLLRHIFTFIQLRLVQLLIYRFVPLKGLIHVCFLEQEAEVKQKTRTAGKK